jgi:hypothetical protein
VEKAPAYPADDALLVCVSLTPTAIDQWRARYKGQEVGVTRAIAIIDRFDNPLVVEALELFSVECDSTRSRINRYPIVDCACSQHSLIHDVILPIAHFHFELTPISIELDEKFDRRL